MYPYDFPLWLFICWWRDNVSASYSQIRTEEMDLIAERGIAAHYSGRVFVTGLVGHAMPTGKGPRGKPVSLTNANIALRVQLVALDGLH